MDEGVQEGERWRRIWQRGRSGRMLVGDWTGQSNGGAKAGGEKNGNSGAEGILGSVMVRFAGCCLCGLRSGLAGAGAGFWLEALSTCW